MKKLIGVALAAVLAAGCLTACGSSDSAATSAASEAVSEAKSEATEAVSEAAETAVSSASSAVEEAEEAVAEAVEEPAATGELQEVTMVMPRTLEVLEDTAFYAGIDMGYFEQEGIKVKMEQAFGSTDSKMVATGNADFCAPSPSYVLNAIDVGLPVKAVSQYGMIQIFGCAVLNDSDIQSFKDMEGHTVALGDASWQLLLQPILMKAGVDESKIEYIVAGDNRYVQVAEGKIDVLFTWVGEIYQLIGQGYDFRYIDGNEVCPQTSNPILTNTKLIEEHPDLVQGFVTGFQKGLYFVLCNKEAAADISLHQFPSIEISWDGAVATQEGIIAQSFGFTEEDHEKYSNPVGYMYEEKWQLNNENCLAAGQISELQPLEDVYTNEFIENGMDEEDRAQVEEDAANYEFRVRDQYE